MDGGDLLLGLRVALALACVLGLMWYVAKRMSGNPKGMLGGRRRTAAMAVVGRQSLGGKTGLAVVEVSGRRLLLGISERGVNLLTELEPELAEPAVADVSTQITGPLTERVELDPALLERSLAAVVSAGPHRSTSSTAVLSTPAARMPAVPKPRNPLEGSILDAALWRQAVVAVQERTIRH